MSRMEHPQNDKLTHAGKQPIGKNRVPPTDLPVSDAADLPEVVPSVGRKHPDGQNSSE